MVIARGAVVIVMSVVFAPLPHITVHVMEAPAIGREAGYLRSLLSINALGAKAVGAVGGDGGTWLITEA